MDGPTIRRFPVPIPEGMPAPATEAAIAGLGDLVREHWVRLAVDHSVSGAYISALQDPGAVQYPYEGDANRVGVINTLPQAGWLEWGRAGFHLPDRWGTGKGKWKTSAKGKRYAVVPFRQRTPTRAGGGSTPERRRMEMPQSVYNAAKRLEHAQSLKASDLLRISGYGKATVGDYGLQSKSYEYYRQAFGADSVPDYLPQGYTWKTPKYEGLTRYTDPEHKHTSYMTFRVITEDSPGWYIPPTPAHHYSARALDAASGEISARLAIAASLDLTHAMLAAVSPLF